MVSNINVRSSLLEPDAKVCLPGTVECWRVTLKVVALGTRWSQIVPLRNGRMLSEANVCTNCEGF